MEPARFQKGFRGQSTKYYRQGLHGKNVGRYSGVYGAYLKELSRGYVENNLCGEDVVRSKIIFFLGLSRKKGPKYYESYSGPPQKGFRV